MIVPLITFIVALGILLISARYFTNSAEKIGLYFQMPAFVIGVFIVGIGTSLPELISAILSVSKGYSEIVAGNVMGSNISNILLITGILAMIHQIDIQLSSKYIFIDLHYLLGCMFILTMFSYDGRIDWPESVLGLSVYVIYSIYLLKHDEKIDTHHRKDLKKNGAFPWVSFLILAISGAGIYFGAEYTIEGLETIARELDVPRSVIALTGLSLGTTLPELVVNLTAVKKGNAEMALGNVLGSSIFNTLMVPTIASFFGTVTVPDNLLEFSLPVMLASALFFYLITQDKKVSRWEGMLFVVIYVLFLMKVVMRN